MPESSVRIKLGIELDKSEFGQQVLELQKELDKYKLSIGIQGNLQQDESLKSNGTDSVSSSQDTQGDSNDSVDFGGLSDLVNNQFGEVTALVSGINNNFYQCIEEIKTISSAFKSLSPSTNSDRLTSSGTTSSKDASTDTVLGDVIRETSDKIVTGLEKTWNRVGLLLSKSQPSASIPAVNTGGVIENQSAPINIPTPNPVEIKQESSVEPLVNIAEEIRSAVSTGVEKLKSLINSVQTFFTGNNDKVNATRGLTPSPDTVAQSTNDLPSVFRKIIDEAIKQSGLSPEQVAAKGLTPQVKIDSSNALNGASGYDSQNNQIVLSQDAANGLSPGALNQESIATLLHEVRHAIQLGFGEVSLADAAQSAQANSRIAINGQPNLMLQNEGDLLFQNKIAEVLNQVSGSTALSSNDLPSSGVAQLELDAEVFAQNLSEQLFKNLEAPLPTPNIDLYRANVSSVAADNPLSAIEKELIPSVKNIEKELGDIAKDFRRGFAPRTIAPLPENISSGTSNNYSSPDSSSLLNSIDRNLAPSQENLIPQGSSLVQSGQPRLIEVTAILNDESSELLRKLFQTLLDIHGLLKNLRELANQAINEIVAVGVAINRLPSGMQLPTQQINQQTTVVNQSNAQSSTQNQQSNLSATSIFPDPSQPGIDVSAQAPSSGADASIVSQAQDAFIATAGNFADSFGSAMTAFTPALALLAQVIPLGSLIYSTLRTINPVQTRFQTIAGSQQGGGQMIDFATNVAKDLNTSILSSVEGYSMITAAAKDTALEGQDTEQLFIGISQAVSALGLDAESASGIFLALGQIISKGVVSSEEWKQQIGEKLPGAMQIGAKALGMSVTEFGKAMENGEITANTFVRKIGPALQAAYADSAKVASSGFIGSVTKIENSLFQLKTKFVDAFGGIFTGLAQGVGAVLDGVSSLMDNIFFKSGMIFSGITLLLAQFVIAAQAIFSTFTIPPAFGAALIASYGKLALFAIPAILGIVQQVISNYVGESFGIEIEGAIPLIVRAFTNVKTALSQVFAGITENPQQAIEGLINVTRSVSLSVTGLLKSLASAGKSIKSEFSGIQAVFQGLESGLTGTEKAINNISNKATTALSTQGGTTPDKAAPGTGQGIFSDINTKAIAKTTLEFSGIFLILLQVKNLLGLLTPQIGVLANTLKALSTGLFAAAFQGGSLISVFTLGLGGLNLLFIALLAVLVLIAARSDLFNQLLPQLDKTIANLDQLNKSLDALTGKKIDIQTRIQGLDTLDGRKTPFENKGLNLTPWRSKDQEKFTTDDIIRGIQSRIDSTSYRRDLPLIPNGFNQARGSMSDQGNLAGLGNVLTSNTGVANQPQSFEELVAIREKLAKERATIENSLTLDLKLDSTNTFDELKRLKTELGTVDSALNNIQEKRDNLGKKPTFIEVITNTFRSASGDRPDLRPTVTDVVGAASSPISPFGSPGLIGKVSNLLLGLENINLAEQAFPLQQRKKSLESQIASTERQAALTPGSDISISLTPVETQIKQLQSELNRIDGQIRDTTSARLPLVSPTLGFPNLTEFNNANKVKSLERQRESLVEALDLLQQSIGISSGKLEAEIRKRSRRIEQLNIPSAVNGRTTKEQNNREVQRLEAEITALSAQKQSVDAAPAKEELSRINQDLRAINLFADTPTVFNNAFNQNDTVLKDIVSQQLDFFSMVQDSNINQQRLDQGNLVQVLPDLQLDVQTARDSIGDRIKLVEDELSQLDTTSEGAQKRFASLNKELKSLNNRLIGLKGLNTFLGVAQSYSDLGAGKQSLDQSRVTRSLTRLSETLKDSPVQSAAVQQFQAAPTLPNLAKLEQDILVQLVPAQQAVSRAKSEKENIRSTPVLRTEKDLRSAGFVTEDQKKRLDGFKALEEKVQREIQDARNQVSDAYSNYNDATANGLDFTPALENYYAVGNQLEQLQKQLQDLRNERDKFLDEVKTIVPPIQVDDTAREQRLAEVDQAIKDAEFRVNELAKQFQVIQETKSGLGGLGQLGENLSVAAADLREPLKGFAAIREFITRNKTGTAKTLDVGASVLTPALETVGGFVNQQPNLSTNARAALVGGLNSGDYAQTKRVVESIEIKDGKVYFGGEELTGTNQEIKAFIDALNKASRVLNFIGDRSSNGSKPVQQAIEEAFGLKSINTQRTEITDKYFSQIASLATQGVFSESQRKNLTRDGVKVSEVQQILGEVKAQDGLPDFQGVVQRLAERGASRGEQEQVLQTLKDIETNLSDALALDPKGASRLTLGTAGGAAYGQTIDRIETLSSGAFAAADKLGVQNYNGNLASFEAVMKEIRPDFIDNIAQLKSLEGQLQQIGQQRLLLTDELQRTDLTKEARAQLENFATALDDEFKQKYREKKVAGSELTQARTAVTSINEEFAAIADEIKASDYSQPIKDNFLEQIENARKKAIAPVLAVLGEYDNIIAASGEEAVEAASKAITKALENFEKIAKLIDANTTQKLADITTAVNSFSTNASLAITDFNKSVAAFPGDPVRIKAETDLARATVNTDQSRQKLDAAQKSKADIDAEYRKIQLNSASSPTESAVAVELNKGKQIDALNIFAQAQEEYFSNLAAQTDAQLALIDAQTQAPVRISQFNSRQKGNGYKQQLLSGTLQEEDVAKLQLNDEIALLDIQIASTATALETISTALEKGYIKNIDIANGKIEELSNTQQELIANRLDKLLEKENQERQSAIKLLEEQSNLSSKYFDVALNGYQLLNKETERYSKQLDNLTRVGEQLKTLSQAQFQVKIGRSENQLSIADTAVATRERLSAQDLSPRERSFQQRRLGALASLGQSYGVQPAAFGANEDAALAEQQKIATKLAKDKLEAMKKEQAIAAKLLDIELQRNQIAAEMAVREAEISKLRAEQAVTQAQFGLQQALLGTDDTAIKLAELELQIAKSQQGLSDAELGSAKENLALQSLFSQLQKEAFNLDSASARDGLITEVAGNQNVDIASILQSLKNFKNFDPNKANPREVFKPYLDWIESQTPKRDPNTPIGLPLEAFNGDIQAWIEANVAIAKQDEANKKSSAPAEIQSLESLFTRVFGAPVASKIDISNGPVKDIGEEIARLNAGRLGEKIAPTQEMIDSVSGQRDINNALEQARRLAQSTEPIDNSRMASDIYAMSTSMADSAASLLTIQELLGRITNGTATGVSVAVPDLGQGGQALDDVNKLIDSQQNNLRGILNDIVLPQAEDLSNGNGSKAVPASQGTIGTERFPVRNKPYTLDLKDSILPPPVPYNPTTTTPSSPEQKVSSLFEPIIKTQSILPPAEANTQSNMGELALAMARPILNPTIQNSVTPRYSPPAVNVDMQNKQPDYFYQRLAQTPNIDIASAQREPGYFYRNLASEVSPQVAYRVPPGIQATQGATSYRPASNTTINITNKIDAASQREMYAKIGETQSKSILSALNQLA